MSGIESLEIKTVIEGSINLIVEVASHEDVERLVQIHEDGGLSELGFRVKRIQRACEIEGVHKMPTFFVSYKRSDSGPTAVQIYKSLQEEFGPSEVFLDFFSIPAGSSFVDVITKCVEGCRVLIGIVGKHWIKPSEWIELEIGIALERQKEILPVLIGTDTKMPERQTLPDRIKQFAERNAMIYDHYNDETSLNCLVTTVQQLLEGRVNPTRG